MKYGKWEVKQELKPDRAFLATSNGVQGVVKIGRNINLEIDVLQRLDHPNIVKLMDYDLKADVPYLVTEYCELGSLNSAPAIEHISGLTVLEFDKLLGYVFTGWTYLLSKGMNITHLLPHDIFLTSSGIPIIGDFEGSKALNYRQMQGHNPMPQLEGLLRDMLIRRQCKGEIS